MTNQQLAEQFFLQIAVILLVCRVVGIVGMEFRLDIVQFQ